MDAQTLKLYTAMGRVQAAVSGAADLDMALRDGLSVILSGCEADSGVIWYCQRDTDKLLRPYYWICPGEMTTVTHAAGEGLVGRVFESGGPETLTIDTSEKKKDIPELSGTEAGCVLCIPFSDKLAGLGCVEFARNGSGASFSEEEKDFFQILVYMAEIAAAESSLLPPLKSRGEVLLSARGIEREFVNGETVTKVLKGVDMDVFAGEFLVILGESGCGKSTMLNILGGMDKATAGRFTFKGTDLTDADEDTLTDYRRKNIGFIFQSYNLMPNLNALQNLQLIGELVDAPEDPEEMLRKVGMEAKKENYPARLSGGQQQRVCIARALVKKPGLIFADEPTAALDYTTSIEVLTALEEVVAGGTTLVMVTHNEEIAKMADRVIRFRNGRVYEVTVNPRPKKAAELIW